MTIDEAREALARAQIAYDEATDEHYKWEQDQHEACAPERRHAEDAYTRTDQELRKAEDVVITFERAARLRLRDSKRQAQLDEAGQPRRLRSHEFKR